MNVKFITNIALKTPLQEYFYFIIHAQLFVSMSANIGSEIHVYEENVRAKDVFEKSRNNLCNSRPSYAEGG